jgi:hypothetical protein
MRQFIRQEFNTLLFNSRQHKLIQAWSHTCGVDGFNRFTVTNWLFICLRHFYCLLPRIALDGVLVPILDAWLTAVLLRFSDLSIVVAVLGVHSFLSVWLDTALEKTSYDKRIRH